MLAGGVALRRATRMVRGPGSIVVTASRRGSARLCSTSARREARRPTDVRAQAEREGDVLVVTDAAEEDGKKKVAYLCAKSSCDVPVLGATGDGVEVQDYLKLPIEQYFISDPDRITKVSENEFLFQLPRLLFFNVWVAPVVTMSVRVTEEPQTVVNIEAMRCVVEGSSFVEKMRINDRLRIKVRTSLREAEGGEGDASLLRAATNLEVWCEIVPPFNLLPKKFLEKSCNAVLKQTLKTLLKSFLVELKEDYHAWSTDAEYREERARRSL